VADFTSGFWNWFIIVPTVLGIIAMFWLIRWLSTDEPPSGDQAESMGHVWDEDLHELNNPLPRWWLNLFYITLFYSIGYLALFPGLGTFQGWLGWSSVGRYEQEMQTAEQRYGPLYQQFLAQNLVALSEDPNARKVGERLFATYCATCHGSDARGARGFPNLRDDDWLWGGSPEAIKQTIVNGRTGAMPSWEAALGGSQGVTEAASYVLSLSGRNHEAELAARGEVKFQQLCVACHGMTGTGNQALGAPNLTDRIWLHGASPKQISESIAKGRTGTMPPHGEFLGEAKVHLLAAYVYGLSEESK